MEDQKKIELNIEQIKEILPHRYPMLLVDKVLDLIPGESALAIKNLSFNEEVFQGHFPNEAIFPGVLIVEALAQTAALSVLYGQEDAAQKSVYFVKIDKVTFKGPAKPGDQITLYAKKTRSMLGMFIFEAEAKIDGKTITTGTITATIQK